MVIDSLKPRETTILDLSKAICSIDGVDEVEITVTEVDVKTETIKLIIKGRDINYDNIMDIMEENSAVVRSVDEINVSKVGEATNPSSDYSST
jgi:hypothetical protein